MIILKLYIEFFKIGLFTYGGGLAMLPLLQERGIELGWLTKEQFVDMIAISQSTPGPIGINMATFVGYAQAGILGAIIASIAIVLPGFIIVMIISRFLVIFNKSPMFEAIFSSLRAAVIGLIATATINIALISIINVDEFIETKNIMNLFEIKSLLFFIIMLFLVLRYNKHPLYYIVSAGIIGIIIW